MSEGKRKKLISSALVYLVLTVILIIAIFPVLYTILGSFKGNMELLTEGNRLFPRKFVLDNYIQAWNLADFEKYTVNSVFMSGTIVIGTIVTSTIAGYVFERGDFPGKNLLFGLVISSMFVSLGSLTLFPIDESAKVDGCSFFGIYRRIIFPLLKPLIATIAILEFRHSWNDYLMPMVFTLSNPDRMPLIVGIMNLKGSGEAASSWNLMLAGSSIALIPMIIVYLIFNRYFIEGLTAGSVKG